MFIKIKNPISKKVHITEEDKEKVYIQSNGVKSDVKNIIFLLLLYMVQGIPLGISSVIPLLIQDKVSYSKLSIFCSVSLPFSLKLLWAPIVDSKYIKSIGRRKSWIIPLQTTCGSFMIFFSTKVNLWLSGGENDINLYMLTAFFFLLFFLMATQDIAVDGWAITMLCKQNRHYASTCNVLGQNFGHSISQLTFLTLNNKNVCFYIFKKYIHLMHVIFYNSTYYKSIHDNVEFTYSAFQPFLNMEVYLKFWGIFILTLTIIALFKKEIAVDDEEEQEQEQEQEKDEEQTKVASMKKRDLPKYLPLFENVVEDNSNINEDKTLQDKENENKNEKDFAVEKNKENVEDYEIEYFEDVKSAYKNLHKLIYLPPIKIFITLCILSRLPFSSVEVGTNFKILKRGLSKEEFAIFNPFFFPVAIISPALIGNFMKKIKPLNVYYFGYKIRFLSNLLMATTLPMTHFMYFNKYTKSHSSFYLYYVYLFLTQAFNIVCVDIMSVSLMGFQNNISDPKIGGTYMTFLNAVNNLSSYASKALFLWLFDYTDKTFCYKEKCMLIDGYYIQMFFSFFLGMYLSHYILKCIRKLQEAPTEAWRVSHENNDTNGTMKKTKQC